MEVPSSFDVVVSADGLAFYGSDFWSGEESVRLWEALSERVAWKQQSIRIFGRFVVQPRLTCWMGDDGVRYTYSGLTHDPEPWIPEVLQLKCALERTLAVSFNGVLLNLYRNGLDSMGWHRDNEIELGKEPVIASVSLGATRRFLLRRYKSRDDQVSFQLGHGSVLVMAGALQEFWEHSLPKVGKKTAMSTDLRINLTFRKIIHQH